MKVPWYAYVAAAVLAFTALVLAFTACGAGAAFNYAGITTACVGAERAIENRSGSTYEEDVHDVAVIRAVCERVRTEVRNGGQ